MSQAAVDDARRAARPRADRGQHLPGRQPRRGAPAGVRRPGGRPGAGGGGPHRRARAGASTRCTPTSCGPATRTSRSSTRSTASATAARSPPAGSSPSSTARRSSTCRRSFHVHEDGPRPPGARCPRRARRPRRCPTSRRAWRRTPSSSATWYDRPRPIDIRHVDWQPAGPQRAAAAVPAGVAPGRRRAARRPGAARVRAHLRVAT